MIALDTGSSAARSRTGSAGSGLAASTAAASWSSLGMLWRPASNVIGGLGQAGPDPDHDDGGQGRLEVGQPVRFGSITPTPLQEGC